MASSHAGPGAHSLPGWNVTKTSGPIYLFQEHHDQKLNKSSELDNDGHHFVTKNNMRVVKG